MRNKNLEERNKKIIEEYKENKITIKDIAQKYNIAPATVTRIARINNISRRNGSETKKLSQQEKEIIIKLHSENKSVTEIQKQTQINYYSIIKVLREKGLKPVTRAKIYNPDFDESYFKEIDTPEKAYWIGWLISDGNVDPDCTISISLQSKDEDILHLLEKDLGVEGKVRSVNKYVRFAIGSKLMYEDLVSKTITPCKSFSVELPKIKKNLYHHLLRGLFDGDGGISVYKGTHNNKGKIRTQWHQELSFCGNLKVITKVKEILEQNIPQLSKKKIEPESSIFRIRWSKKSDIKLIYEYLYQDCGEHFLSRKKNKIEQIFNANTEIT